VMRRVADVLVLAAVLVGIAWMTTRYAVVPVWENVRVAKLENQLREALADKAIIRKAGATRQVAETASRISEASDLSVHSRVLAAIANLAMSQPEKAREWYCQALRIDRRPEIYLGIAEAELAMGEREDAIGHLTLALIHRPSILNRFRDLSVLEDAYNRSQSILPPASVVIRNTRLVDDRLPIASYTTVAPGWSALGSPRTHRVASASSSAIRIEATAGEGIYQLISSAVPPASVLVEVEGVTTRGRIGVIAGPFPDPSTAVAPEQAGEGRLRALSRICPVRYVGLVCLSDSCEFEVQRVLAVSDGRGRCDLPSFTLVDEPLPPFDPALWMDCRD
jgi:hypothetical protein